VSAHREFRSVRARVPAEAIEPLAEDASVIFIAPRRDAQTWGQPAGGTAPR
jgi:hypothetical protein